MYKYKQVNNEQYIIILFRTNFNQLLRNIYICLEPTHTLLVGRAVLLSV